MEPDVVILGKSLVTYTIYSPEGNDFWRGGSKLQFWWENLPNSIK